MARAGVREFSSTSRVSFEDAIRLGILRARQSVRNFRDAWVRDQRMDLADGQAQFSVKLHVRYGAPDSNVHG